MTTQTTSRTCTICPLRSLSLLAILLFITPCLFAEQPPATQPQTCTLAGKVLQLGTDKPAPHLALSAYITTPDQQSDYLEFTTDEHGVFRTTVPAGSYVDLQWQDSPDGSYLIDDNWQRQGNGQPLPRLSANRDLLDLLLHVKLIPVTQLQGRVLNPQGQPLPDVTVYAGPRLPTATTDSTGSFTLKGVPQGRDLHLLAVRDGGGFIGFFAKRMLGTVAPVKYPTTNPTLTLAPCQSFQGQVLTPDGLPAAQLTFTLMPKLGRDSLYHYQQSVTTDAAGKFSTPKLIPDATYEISWRPTQDDNRDYDYGKITLDLSQLKPGDPIKFIAPQYLNALMGQVVNENGVPIKEAAIFVRDRKLLPRDAWYKPPFQTDAKGQFVIPRLAPGKVTLHISAQGYKSHQFTAATDSIDFQATLKPPTPTCQYRLLVVDENNHPLPNAPIRIASTQPVQVPPTDNTGLSILELPISSNPENRHLPVLCDMPGRDIAFDYLPPHEDVEIRLVAPKAQSPWRGRVLDDQGKPVPNAKVQITSINPDADDEDQDILIPVHTLTPLADNSTTSLPHLLTQTDAAGRFQFTRVSSHPSIAFTLSAPGYVESSGNFIASDNPNKDEQEFTLLTAGSVKGRIVLKATNQPPTEKPEMNIQLQGGSADWVNMDVQSDWTFSSDAVAPGIYTPTLQPRTPQLRKYVCNTPPIVRVTARASADLLIELEEGIRIHGKLLDAHTSKPLSGTIMASLANAHDSSPIYTTAQPDGSWDLYLPHDGDYHILYLSANASENQTFKIISVKRSQPPEELIIRAQPPQ